MARKVKDVRFNVNSMTRHWQTTIEPAETLCYTA